MPATAADGAIRYAIFDPTGNITALVEDAVDEGAQPDVARRLMGLHPEVEQVGFVSGMGQEGVRAGEGPQLRLRMAGGEFCGNASLCAAALCVLRSASRRRDHRVRLAVSGTTDVVEVRLRRDMPGLFFGSIRMPSSRAIERIVLRAAGLSCEVPVVHLEGISHALIEQDSPFFSLLRDRLEAERAARSWCAELAVAGLGLMFSQGEGPMQRLTPLVYVPIADTLFWESSCASGSAALGMHLATSRGSAVEVALDEPGGSLQVRSDPCDGTTWLSGRVRHVLSGSADLGRTGAP